MQIDVFTLFPQAFDWFVSQRHGMSPTPSRSDIGWASSTTGHTRR
jgi:hypothetical protein